MGDNIEEKVIQITADTLGTQKSDISLDSKFIDDLGADSLDQVEFTMAIEEEFDCTIPDEEAAKIVTVSDAIDVIKKHMESA
ncbi:MAG TPA: acyl carrier protein [Candidatus Megaira endosymbiont of Nemacystus decipiens]|nr:acyl carrier protein [Candidatus Megaera endosymbiont of Nemacystus decipiens]